VRLLLDTHTLLWWLTADPTLSTDARNAIGDSENLVVVSAATAWELSIKTARGKLRTPDDLVEQLDANAFIPLPITIEDGLAAGSLPRHHDDPFDRMLIAQAITGGWTVVTKDSRFAAYGIDILPA
jgi:PIN domain nuclease of toxin-antitoxin system